MKTGALSVLLAALMVAPLLADDWPQWRGPDRDGVCKESGLLDRIPAQGLKVRWRARVAYGYSGPTVAQGRVFISDRNPAPEAERILCFSETTGKLLWSHSDPCDYATMEYGNGPRVSPTVHDGKVYGLGTKGNLVCLDAASGHVVWQKDLVKEGGRVPQYGASVMPLVEGDVLIVSPGYRSTAVMALDRLTGAERWTSLPEDRPAYSPPITVTAGGTRQAIVWTADSVAGLEPAAGTVLWRIPYKATFDPAQAVASPVVHKQMILCLAAWNRGSMMLKLDDATPTASMLWKTRSQPTTTISTPIFPSDDYFYGISGDGSLCCLNATNGDEIWSTRAATSAKFGNAHLTPNGDRVFLFNQTGHLILSRLTPDGYQELGRCLLVEPTSGFRASDPVAWAHPAYANKHIFVRNDRELICAALDPADYGDADFVAPTSSAKSEVLTGTTGPEESLALSVAFSPDGKVVALGSGWGVIRLLELAGGKVLPAPKRHNDWVCAVAFSPNGKLLVSAGGSEFTPARNGGKTSAEIKLWDLEANAELGQFTGHTSKVFTAAFSPDSKSLATGSADRTVRIWDVATMKDRLVLNGHTDTISSVAFSSDGSTVASASRDHTVKIWDTTTGQLRGSLQEPDDVMAVALSPEGQYIASGGADWNVRLWDAATFAEVVTLKGHHGTIYSLAFSSDGKTLASGSGDETIKLWNVHEKTQQQHLIGHRSGVSAVAFGPANKILVSAAMNDPVRIWDLNATP